MSGQRKRSPSFFLFILLLICVLFSLLYFSLVLSDLMAWLHLHLSDGFYRRDSTRLDMFQPVSVCPLSPDGVILFAKPSSLAPRLFQLSPAALLFVGVHSLSLSACGIEPCPFLGIEKSVESALLPSPASVSVASKPTRSDD